MNSYATDISSTIYRADFTSKQSILCPNDILWQSNSSLLKSTMFNASIIYFHGPFRKLSDCRRVVTNISSISNGYSMMYVYIYIYVCVCQNYIPIKPP